MKKIRVTVIFIMGAALAAGAFLFSSMKSIQAATGGKAEASIAVSTRMAQKGTLDDYLEFGGEVKPVSSIQVRPNVSGKITGILVSQGQKISSNQVIAEVNASLPGATYSSSPVRSPINGTVVSSLPSVGMYVDSSTSIVEIASTDALKVTANIPARFISRVQKDQTAVITFDSYENMSFSAKVKTISPVIDSATRTMEITLYFSKNDEHIKSGMYAHIHLITEHISDAVIIPSSAIVKISGQSYVFSVKNKKGRSYACKIPVTVGLYVDNRSEIISGLSEGTEIIVKGQSALTENQLITPIADRNE